MRTRAALLGGLALLTAACAAPATRLAGRVLWQGDPLVGAAVTLEPEVGGAAAEAVTDADGVYRFPPVPPGTYRVRARGPLGGPPLGAVPGKNPVALAPGGDAWLGLLAVPWEEPVSRPLAAAATGFGAVGGTVRLDGKPAEGAVVSLYLDEAVRGPGVYQAFPTGPDGAYAVDEVPAGSYYLVARKRQGGGSHGPVREGDLYAVAPANPVAVAEAQETRLDLHLVRKERDDDPGAELLALVRTGLRGRLLDPSGAPAAGVYVFAYRDRIVGHRMPDYLTLPTGPDGTFALPLGDGGLFYVGARERSGGSPAPGERFGFYEGSPDHGIVVPRGRVLEGIEIVVRKVLEP